MPSFVPVAAFVVCLALLTGCSKPPEPGPPIQPAQVPAEARTPLRPLQARIVEGALAQLKEPAAYSGAYYRIEYPGGDVPADRGACTDVVVRALRNAGIDLQLEVAQAIRSGTLRVSGPQDTNIDHRRCPNLSALFRSKGWTVPDRGQWQPGDIVFWKLSDGKDHTGVLTDNPVPNGRWTVVHNIGPTVREEDCLDTWKVVGHYRVK